MPDTRYVNRDEPMPAARNARASMESLTFSGVHEVLLLIDHISGRSTKSLKDLDIDGMAALVRHPSRDVEVPAGPCQSAVKVSDVLQLLCHIGYAPDPDPIPKAREATFVLLLKDRLNALAEPAQGLTIAYTAMFVTAMHRGLFGDWRMPHGPPDLNRRDFARAAYPLLRSHAERFAAWFRVIAAFMFILLMLIASAYWDVGFGRASVQRVQEIVRMRDELLNPLTSTAANPVMLTVADCAVGAEPKETPKPPAGCIKYTELTDRLTRSRVDVMNFATAVGGQGNDPFTNVASWLRPLHYGFLLLGQAPQPDHPETTVASVLWLYSSYVLPVMFGALGTFAANTRDILRKAKDNLLSPRDHSFLWLGLITGPVAGLAVGLYYPPEATAVGGPSGLAGAVSLTASGLGFLAGYGADAFFKFVDSILSRVFTPPDPRTK